jgi:tellurite resistance protein
MSERLDYHAALIHTMVLASLAEGQMSDGELQVMSRLVSYLPVFKGFDRNRIAEIGYACAEQLKEEDGLDVALQRIAAALPQPLRETAYAIACDIAAADGRLLDPELQMLEFIRHGLAIDRLIAAGIERGAAARHRVL